MRRFRRIDYSRLSKTCLTCGNGFRVKPEPGRLRPRREIGTLREDPGMGQQERSTSGPRPLRGDRRAFLVASGAGLAGLGMVPGGSAAVGAGPAGARRGSTILFFLCGGASHVDTWDLKPDAPAEYRGPFRPIATTAPGVRFCEHLPMLARQAHHLAVVNSVGATVNTNDHHAGYYYNLTGHVPDPTFKTLGNNRTPMPDDWPYMGCVAASRVPPHPRPARRDHAAAPAEQGPVHAAGPVRRAAGDRARPALRPRRHRPAAPVPGARPDARRGRRRPAAPGPSRPARGRRRGAAGPRSGSARSATGRPSRSAPGGCWPPRGRLRRSTSPPSRRASASVTARPSTA